MATKTTRRKKPQLPEKPSALIRLALDDLETAEKAPNTTIDMERWMEVSKKSKIADDLFYLDGLGKLERKVVKEMLDAVKKNDAEVCTVCLAGSVMKNTLGQTKDANPEYFPDHTANRLRALNEFRTGCVVDGLCEMGLDLPEGMTDYIDIVEYSDNPAKFKSDMRALAKTLEKAGL